jgi:hypothetical protein
MGYSGLKKEEKGSFILLIKQKNKGLFRHEMFKTTFPKIATKVIGNLRVKNF